METKQRKNDLIDLIIDELKKSGKVENAQKSSKTETADSEDEFDANAAMEGASEDNVKFDNDEVVLIANALLFFFAGFDTTSTGFGMVCHKLCMYPVNIILCLPITNLLIIINNMKEILLIKFFLSVTLNFHKYSTEQIFHFREASNRLRDDFEALYSAYKNDVIL